MIEPRSARPPSRAAKIVALVGGAAMLGAMLTDCVAVIGRHTGLSLLGSIEVAQALVLVSGAASLVIATREGSHAVVSLLVDRLPPSARAVLMRINAVLSALFFLLIAWGSAWIALDMRGAHEVSELLAIPMAPLRLIGLVSAIACSGLFLWQALRGKAR
jgi:TRAP-type C4-dicarboxylate transport system permease small subunit